MCGIVGFVGREEAAPILLDGLSRLEYRGYDSAGIAVYGRREGLQVVKAKGRLQVLQNLVQGGRTVHGTLGLGHTRWATHGEPSDVNSHPQVSESGRFAVVHNGIIENYMELREFLQSEGITFVSQTDTEVVAQLLEHYYDGDILDAVVKTLNRIQGAYALGIVCADCPDRLIAARKDSPLILGYGEGAHYLASDVTALIKYTREVCYLDDGEIAELTADHLWVYDAYVRPVEKARCHVRLGHLRRRKGRVRQHFMAREIMEQPEAFRKTVFPRIQEGRVVLDELNLERGLPAGAGQALCDRLRLLLPRGHGRQVHPGTAAAQAGGGDAGLRVPLLRPHRYRQNPGAGHQPVRRDGGHPGRPAGGQAPGSPGALYRQRGGLHDRPGERTTCSIPGPGRRSPWPLTKALLHPAGRWCDLIGLYLGRGRWAPWTKAEYDTVVSRAGCPSGPSWSGCWQASSDVQYFASLVLQPPLYLLHRPQHRLRHRHGGLPQAQGDHLTSTRRPTRPASSSTAPSPSSSRAPWWWPWPAYVKLFDKTMSNVVEVKSAGGRRAGRSPWTPGQGGHGQDGGPA